MPSPAVMEARHLEASKLDILSASLHMFPLAITNLPFIKAPSSMRSLRTDRDVNANEIPAITY